MYDAVGNVEMANGYHVLVCSSAKAFRSHVSTPMLTYTMKVSVQELDASGLALTLPHGHPGDVACGCQQEKPDGTEPRPVRIGSPT